MMLTEYWNSEAAFVGKSQDGVHDLIIHGLNRELTYNATGKKVFYPVEPFQQSVNAWDGIPAVYVPNGVHIPPEELNKDSATALAKYGGEFVGKFNNSQVITSGQERLQSQAFITNPTVERGINDGKIAISSTFYSKQTDGRITGPIIPSYVLLFDKDKETPVDDLSSFLNTQHTLEDLSMADIDIKMTHLERDVKEKDLLIATMNSQSTEKDETINALKAELAERDLLMNSQADAKDVTIKALEDELVEFKNSQADLDWNALKETIAPGLVATPELESELRVLHNTNAGAFIKKVMSVGRVAETKPDGTVFMNSSGSNESKYEEFMISEVEK